MESLALEGPGTAAGVEISGMSDPVSFYLALGEDGSTFGPGPMEGNGHVAGPPWTDLENFISSSPVLHADHISAPLLIIQSSEDTAPMPDQAGEMFAALRMLHNGLSMFCTKEAITAHPVLPG